MRRPAGIVLPALILLAACATEEAPETLRKTAEQGFALPIVDLSTLAGPLLDGALADQQKAFDAPDDATAVGRLGMRYLAHDFPQAAAICFGRAADLDPASMDWKYGEGLALEAAGRIPEAIVALERSIKADPGYGPAFVRLGRLLLEEDRDRAGELFMKALEIDPENAAAHLGLGKVARLAGDRGEALRRFRRAVEILPQYADAHYSIAMILSAGGKRDEAARHIEQHTTGGPPPLDSDPFKAEIARLGESAARLRDQAERMARSGDVEEAVALLSRAIERDVSGSTSHIHLGLVLAREGRFEKAAEEFAAALEADPASVEARSSLGLALTELGSIDKARELFTEVLEAHPEHAASLIYLGRLELEAGRTRAGFDLLLKGVEAQPANALYQLTLGEQLARAGREGDARPHLERAVSLSPDNIPARHTLAVVLARIGRLPEARRRWLEVVRLQPDHADAILGLAGVALQQNHAPRAVEYAERACELTSYRRPRFLSTLADAYDAAGRTADAQRVRELLPQR